MAKQPGMIVTALCTSTKVESDKDRYCESVSMGSNDEAPSLTVHLYQYVNGAKRPDPLGFVWGKKYRVTIEPMD